MTRELHGPVGERNIYSLQARGRIAVLPSSELGLLLQISAVLATGNDAVVEATAVGRNALVSLPASVADRIKVVADWTTAGRLAGVLFEGDAQSLRTVDRIAAELPGPIVAVHALSPDELSRGTAEYPLEWLVEEQSISTNTAAAGGNASLMTLG